MLTYLSSGFGAAGAPFPSGLTADVAGVSLAPSSFAVVFSSYSLKNIPFISHKFIKVSTVLSDVIKGPSNQ